MDENELRNLLCSISNLAMHGDIPVQAFGTLISSARGELVSEHLHQRWLSDPNFAKIVAEIVFQLHGIENRNVTVCSQVLALTLRDFKSRRKIRKRSRHMFRNYFRTLVELYPVYRQMDKYLSACLIEPLFRCLQMLVDDSPDDNDLRCVANVMIASGQALNQLNPTECDNTMIKCRKWLISNIIELQETTKHLLFNALDLWTYSWDVQSFPECLRRLYEEKEMPSNNSLNESNKKNVVVPGRCSVPGPEIALRKVNNRRRADSSSATMESRRLQKQPSIMDAHFSVLAKAEKSESDHEEKEKSDKTFDLKIVTDLDDREESIV